MEVKCCECNKIENVDDCVIMRIPGGIRGQKVSRNVYFCNDECKKLFEDNKICQICRTSYKYEMIDGKRVCKDESQWMQVPTCLNLYTGNYKCSICKSIKNVKDSKCFYLNKNDNKCVFSSVEDTLYICSGCCLPFKHLFLVEGMTTVLNGRKLSKMM